MSKPTDIRVVEATSRTQQFAYRTPMKFGGRVVRDAVVLDVQVVVESRDGKRGQGAGSMPLGNIWGWPSSSVSSDTTCKAMAKLGERLVHSATDTRKHGHPLDLTTVMADTLEAQADTVTHSLGLEEHMPRLAQLVAASPLEAAIHDAYGKMLGLNSFDTLGAEFANCDLGHFLGDDFAGEYLDRYTLRQPKANMPLYHLVGALDPLFDSDVDLRVGDQLPETLGEWIASDGLTHLKIKLSGDDLAWDVERLATVEVAASEVQRLRGCDSWHYSLDFNERCSDVGYVLDFLDQIQNRSPQALARVQYIEQPTHRNLDDKPEYRMHEAARIKPVVIDESLVDLDSLLLARRLGYSGVALKACKGQTESLLMGAAAQKYGMFLCVQDLTCPGASFLHSASLAARIPGVAAIEGNARQYCPAGNEGWDKRYPSMFQIGDGSVGTSVLDRPGLGF